MNKEFDPSTDYIGISCPILGQKLFTNEYKSNLLRYLHSSHLINQLASSEHLKGLKNKIIHEMISEMSSEFMSTAVKSIACVVLLCIVRNTKCPSSLLLVIRVMSTTWYGFIDYLVVSYVLYRMGIALPHIAAGDNLNLPFVGWVLRKNGAFFIRREWGDDKLYIAIMKEYINYLLMTGYNVEAFVEGTRSRTGKLLKPKLGFLKLILESVLENPGRDAMIIPVNIGYDKVIEAPSYVNELMGTPKKKESIFQLFNNINVLQLKWGRIDVRFGEPFSVSRFIGSIKSNRQIPAPFKPSTYNYILQSLGYKILLDINRITSIMPTALVGTILLTLRGRGVGRNELIRKVNWLKNEIIMRGGQVAESGQSTTGVLVDRAVGVMNDLIGKRRDILESVYYPLKRFELSYYRNQVIHLFVPECVVSVAMYGTIKAGGPVSGQRIPIKAKLLPEVKFLSQLLRFEFVFEQGGVHKNLDECLEKLLLANVIKIGHDKKSNESWVTLSDEERRTGRETFDFYCFLLWPFVETYWLCAVSLYTILPDRIANPSGLYWLDLRVFINRSQIFGKTLFYEGDVSYFESVNKETIANAIGWYKQLGIIKLHKGAEPPSLSHYEISNFKTNLNSIWIALSKEWTPDENLPDAGISPSIPSYSSKKRRDGHETGIIGEMGSTLYDVEQRHQDYHVETATESGSHDKQDRNETSRIENLTRLSGGQPTSRDKRSSSLDEQTDLEHDYWSNHRPKGKLWNFCEEIGKYRREGKNRRDTSTVAIRVLRLAQLASHWNGGKKRRMISVSGTAKL